MSLIVGVITSFYIIVQPMHAAAIAAAEDSHEQSEKRNDAQKVQELTKAVPSSNSQINIEFHSFLIEIVEETEEQITVFVHEITDSVTGAIKLILTEIISPNAP